MVGNPMICDLCGEEGARKVRVDLFPSMRRCVKVCAPCAKGLPGLIAELRAEIEASWGLTQAR